MLATVLVVLALRDGALAAHTVAEIDQAVLSTVSSLYGDAAEVVVHVELTKPFDAESEWTLVAAKVPDKVLVAGEDWKQGPISICFVKNGVPDCSEKAAFDRLRPQGSSATDRLFFDLRKSEIVYAGRRHTRPLLLLQACGPSGMNGNCGIGTLLFGYDRAKDVFRPVFVGVTGRNMNQETRFVEDGPLRGSVIVVSPTGEAPYAYHVELYQPGKTGPYGRVVRYRSRTGYGDGNRLAVIDAEMPSILQRRGLWKAGDPIPLPARRPVGCDALVVREGVVWCK
jgi:hypothetical protein